MIPSVAKAGLLSVVLTFALTVACFWVFGPITSLPGAQFVDRVEICGDVSCDPELRQTVDLPFYVQRILSNEPLQRQFVLPAAVQDQGHAGHVIYLPFAPNSVELAGLLDTFQAAQVTQLGRPRILALPEMPSDEVMMRVHWLAQDGMTLHPFYIGPENAVIADYLIRQVQGPGLAMTSVILMMASFAICFPIYWFNQTETAFLWLALSNVPGLFIGLTYLLPFDTAPVGYSTAYLILAANAFVTCVLCFMNRLVGVDLPRAERVNMAGVLIHACCVVALPIQWQSEAASLFSFWAIGWALVILTVFQLNKEAMNSASFAALFSLLTLALALSCHDWFVLFTADPWGAGATGQALPATLGAATLWLVVRRLLSTMRNLQELNHSLDQTVARKSRELAKSYAELAESRTKAALNNERNRITVELHDGIGGSLVNILAYAEESAARDPVLEQALEDVLREIGIIMDNVATLDAPLDVTLGGLRHRYEALFAKLGIDIVWQVNSAPDLPDLPPERKLDFVRVVQEAMNNVAKHAKASRVLVRTDRHSVCIEDDGIGTSAAQKMKAPNERSSGLGLRSMAERAAAMGAEIEVHDTGQGTRVCLNWKGTEAVKSSAAA